MKNLQGRTLHRIDFKKLASMALSCSRSLVPTLLTGGVQNGSEWVALNPRRQDSSPGSFKVNLTTGRWSDFATGDKGGDIISLVAYLDGTSQTAAANKLITILGGNYEC